MYNYKPLHAFMSDKKPVTQNKSPYLLTFVKVKKDFQKHIKCTFWKKY